MRSHSETAYLPDRGQRSRSSPTDLVWREGPLAGKMGEFYAWLGPKKSSRLLVLNVCCLKRVIRGRMSQIVPEQRDGMRSFRDAYTGAG
jgi:hypothetical protein